MKRAGCGCLVVLLLLFVGLPLYVYNASLQVKTTIGVETDLDTSALLREPPKPLEEPVTLGVVTFNIQDLPVVATNFELRMRAIAEKLGTLDPDIVGFQESFGDAHREILREGLAEHTRLRHFAYYPSGYMGSGCYIASAYPIVEVFFEQYDASNPWWKLWEGDYWAGKGVALARVELPEGAIDFFDTHAQAGYGVPAYQQVRLLQLTEAAEFVNRAALPDAPAFFVGDLNCGRGSRDYEALVEGAGLQRLMVVDSAIDHILGRPGERYRFEVLETQAIHERRTVDGVTFSLSDHYGYYSRVRVIPLTSSGVGS